MNIKMYNNHQGIYTIRGDMCYENKLMANTALPGRPPAESICLTVSEQDRNSTTSKRRRRPRLRPLLLVNVILVIIVLSSLFLLEFGPIPQTKLGFYCKDPTISFPFRGDTISLNLIVGGSLVGPLLIIAAIELYREKSVNKNWGLSIWRWFRDFMVGFSFNLVITEVAKIVVGEHRPHFLDTCQPDTAQSCIPGEYVSDYKCTSTFYSNYLIIDSSRSFPSGHASISVYVSLFCAFYIHCRLSSRQLSTVVKPFIIVMVLLWAVVCSLTRITDHRHHWWDVAVGTILGIAVAGYTIVALCKSFQQPFVSTKSHRPSASTTTLLDVKNKDATSVII
ncbi:hypothetical protein ILUMI_09023 [Ignelater luminosus]|uniref:Phosphatidic acid phosphatase type 2/haloperoxidase domain-containing protein n=1 Tax=Ignelater luminosus TaxID=2038154 RepID=A0A8K0D6K4_IGNLU|nr:hypothetical protein ILUMI_09023 [Ignelater luminosus]